MEIRIKFFNLRFVYKNRTEINLEIGNKVRGSFDPLVCFNSSLIVN